MKLHQPNQIASTNLDFVDVNHNIQGNPNLNSEYSKNAQIHVTSKAIKNVDFNVKLFYTRINNFITLLQSNNSANFSYVNIGDYKNIGSGFGLKLNFIMTSVLPFLALARLWPFGPGMMISLVPPVVFGGRSLCLSP